MEFTRGELLLLSLALEEYIATLRNRFEEDSRYIHPAIEYEDLHNKLEDFLNNN